MRSHRTAIAGAATLLALAAVVVPAIGSADSCNTDWPMFQHDASRTGSAACSSIGTQTGSPLSAETLAPAWFFQTPGAVTAEPVIASVGGKQVAYVGDYEGNFYAIDVSTGKTIWSFNVKTNPYYDDQHAPSYGEITSSAAVADIPSLGRTVFFAGGGTVYALRASDGKFQWKRDIDPLHPSSSTEVESSPVVWTPSGGNSFVFVGLDTNEDKGGSDGGVVKLNATDGSLVWKFDAERGVPVTTFGAYDGQGSGCGDIWSSPALDPLHKLVFFGGGNCNTNDTQYLYAISATGGDLAWRFQEPAANHTSDTDFGATPVLTHVNGHDVVVQAGKSGWVYVLDRVGGASAYYRQYHLAYGGDIGGFIGSGSVGVVGGHPTFFGDSAIPVHADGSGIDPSPTDNPLGATSLHALDLVTGQITWNAPVQTPSYAPTTVVNDVVFAPDTTGFSLDGYDAATGAPIWHLPIGAATSGGTAVSGNNVVVGVGTFFGDQVPPQVTGVWCFRPAG